MKALFVEMMDLYLIFKFFKRLIPLALIALSFENELKYHSLNARVNSGDDVAILCKNLVNFCRVTPEIMELI